jgi:hypothetical protein
MVTRAVSNLAAKAVKKVLKPKKTRAKIEKNLGKELSDLSEPAATAGTPRVQGQGVSDSIPEYKTTAFAQNSKGKTLTKKMKDLQKLRDKADSFSNRAEKMKWLNDNKEKMDLLKNSIADMKRREIVPKKNGGKVSDTKNATPRDKPTPPIGKGAVARGNRMSKMEANSAKAMNKKMGGGQVMKYKKGGMIYKKGGGVIKASDGDSFVAGCYTNKSIA